MCNDRPHVRRTRVSDTVTEVERAYDRGMPALEPLDLRHLGHERVIGCYLLETPDGPALFDCGPANCVEQLKEGLRARGLELTDLRHLLLSHIHLDHAGAAGVLVREHPELQVHVSPVGAPHLVDPRRLEESARRLYGDEFDTLWGELAPVPRENVRETGQSLLGRDCRARRRSAPVRTGDAALAVVCWAPALLGQASDPKCPGHTTRTGDVAPPLHPIGTFVKKLS